MILHDANCQFWFQKFEFGEKDDSKGEKASFKHCYILHPITGTGKYTKLRLLEARRTNQALQKAAVDLDDVTLALSKVLFMLLQVCYYNCWEFSSISIDDQQSFSGQHVFKIWTCN